MQAPTKEDAEKRLQSANVLIVEDSLYMRKVVRMLLTNVGVKNVYEAADGISALDQIRLVQPDLIVLDWDLPLLNGPELVRIVRSPGVFPVPDIPIIMLTGFGERWRVVAAASMGVNEFLIKPVSAKTLKSRMISVLLNPRPSVQIGNYYGPAPRKLIDDPMGATLCDSVLGKLEKNHEPAHAPA